MKLLFLAIFLRLVCPVQAAEIIPKAGSALPDLGAALAVAQPGDVVLVPEGTWRGNFRIEVPITLRGAGGWLDGMGQGSVLTVNAPGTIVENLLIRGSGNDLSGPDCGLFLGPEATGTIVRNNRFEDCCFGIWVHKTRGAKIIGNEVIGPQVGHVSNRGNGIHLFDALELEVRGNTISGGRDGLYISATEDSLIEDNHTHHLRFGIHYMYSYDNCVFGNRSHDNTIGFALMQSRNLTVIGNEAYVNTRQGLLFRDAQYCDIRNNVLRQNGEGLFFFSSTDNQIENNTVTNNTIGAKIWAGSYDNDVSGNRFIGNGRQIFYVGGADLVWGEESRGNYWSDYLGWDQDGDGVGDRPYRLDNFSGQLSYRYPGAALLLRSPAIELLSYLERALPVFRVPTIVDKTPMISMQEQVREDP